jgi:hypothetical protein
MAVFHGEMLGVRLNEKHAALQAWRERVASRPPVRKVVARMAGWASRNGVRLTPWAAGLTEKTPFGTDDVLNAHLPDPFPVRSQGPCVRS